MLGLKVDFLTTGCRYDTRRRMALVPETAATAPAETGALTASNR
jgi:hypothetical protein